MVEPTMEDPITEDILIVGSGPAGASLACFLAFYGLKGIIVGAGSSTADTPRAHITNMAAMECLRDIGLEEECLKLASKGSNMMHTRWAYSMAGDEYARVYSWGNDPKGKGEYEAASPCEHIDLPQTLLEPILLRYATQHGFRCRMDTVIEEFEENEPTGIITSHLRDKITSQRYSIRSKYLFGADGARSTIMEQLGIPLEGKAKQGIATDVLIKADLSHLEKTRSGNIHWLIQPDVEHPNYGWLGVARIVKPWHEWIFSLFPSIGVEPVQPTEEQYLERIKEFIGDKTPVEIIKTSKWYINEVVAKEYSRGNVFCLGDAVHRHPPMNGLGSNTCIQDAYNLAWKVALVIRDQASPTLLKTYSVERQPVGLGIISRANDSYRNHSQIWEALGILSRSVSERVAAFAELSANTEAGRSRREKFHKSIEHSKHEFSAVGIEMNQHYESTAIYAADEVKNFEFTGLSKEDAVLHYTPSTYPGCRLPHAWLNSASPGSRISTNDLAGKGTWTVFTGIGGEGWREAVDKIKETYNLNIRCFSIGFRQDFEDVYFDWERLREVKESGCVLVRPDRFVAWRAMEAGMELDRLSIVMNKLLWLKSSDGNPPSE